MGRYLLIGALGGPNFGDEIILAAWINAIRRKDPMAVIVCDGYNLENLKWFVGGRADVLTPEESLWRASYAVASGADHTAIWSHIQANLEDLGRLEITIKCLEALKHRKFDQIHLVGGGYFNSLWRSNYFLLIIARLLGWQTGAKVVATGLGLLPTAEADLSELQGILQTFDLVDVRDSGSLAQLKIPDWQQVSCSGDDALLYLSDGEPQYPLRQVAGKAMVICIQNDLFEGNKIADVLFTAASVEVLKEYGIRDIIYAAAMSTDVAKPSEELKINLESEGFRLSSINPVELAEKGFPVSNGGIIVTSRYHPHFFGALSGYKGIALSAIPYYDTKHAAVRAMGSAWPVLSVEDTCESFATVLAAEFARTGPSFDREAKADFMSRKHDLLNKVLQIREEPKGFPLDISSIWASLVHRLEESERNYSILKSGFDEQTQTLSLETDRRIELEARIQNLEADIRTMHAEIDAYKRDIEQREADVRAMRGEINGYKRDIEQQTAEKEAMLTSRSWKLTAPLRYIASLIH